MIGIYICNQFATMLPYISVTSRTNYARWMPVKILDMIQLPEIVKSSFRSGEFSVKQKAGSFNGIRSDMATENTIIKDSKSSSSTVGITREKPALLRWVFTRHILAYFTSKLKEESSINTNTLYDHEENKPTVMSRDEQQVIQLVQYVRLNMTDTFNLAEHPMSLINISTGLQASKDIRETLSSFL